MKLSKLKLRNFKGIKAFSLDTGGESVTIYGDNATGKTTICDAPYWLLFDKDSQFKSQFEIKTLTGEGEAMHGLDHEVEGTFLFDDGQTITLKKIYKEKWTKKRGSATKNFTGHTTDYEVDGVPVKKKEYTERAGKVFDEDTFKLLTTPSYFAETLPWKQRRDILLTVCGDITDKDVIASDAELKYLTGILGDRALEDHKKVVDSQRAEINKELGKIPVRIDEVQRGLPDVSGIDIDKARLKVDELFGLKQDKEAQLTRIESGGEIAEKTVQLREIEGKLVEAKNAFNASGADIVADMRKEADILRAGIGTGKTNLGLCQSDAEYKRKFIKEAEADMAELRDRWYEIETEQLAYDGDDLCPTCGQSLPEEARAEAKEKALAAFNLDKSTRHESINSKGALLKADVEKANTRIEELKKEEARLAAAIAENTAGLEKLEENIKDLQEKISDHTTSPEYLTLDKQCSEIEEAISKLKSGSREEAIMVGAEIDKLAEERGAWKAEAIAFDLHNKGLDRIKELEAQEHKLAEKYEKLEREIFLMETFTKTKVEMLDNKINSKFKLARFKLFRENINGGIEPCCEVTYNGVPYSGGLNNGARINVGLDIIATLSEHYKASAPVFIDNSEAITDIKAPEGAQVVRLVVSSKDKKLRIETDSGSMEAAA